MFSLKTIFIVFSLAALAIAESDNGGDKAAGKDNSGTKKAEDKLACEKDKLAPDLNNVSHNFCQYNCIDKGHIYCADFKDFDNTRKQACYKKTTANSCFTGASCTKNVVNATMGFKYSLCTGDQRDTVLKCGNRFITPSRPDKLTTNETKVTLKGKQLCSYVI